MPALRQPRRVPSALTIAGSDSGGGAGIQADLKTFAAHGVHGVTAITAITAQNTRAVSAVLAVPQKVLCAQINAVFDDFDIRALKVGMLGTRSMVLRVASMIDAHRDIPLVLDPVMVASSGACLLAADAMQALRLQLAPMALLITPNLPEAELLLGRKIAGKRAFRAAARALLELGGMAVLLKGGHVSGGPITDLYVDREGREIAMQHARLRVAGHGTGCTLSAAITALLALSVPLPAAVARATDYVHGALAAAYRPGRSATRVLEHNWRRRNG